MINYLGCKVTKADLMDLERLEYPFYFDMNVTELNMKYVELARKERATEDEISLGIEIPSRPKDWKTRFGLKGKPLTDVFETTRTISVLHCSWLCMFKFLENAIIRQSAGCLQWGAGVIPKAAHARLKDREKLFKGLLRNLVGYKEGNYGSQVTGNNIKIN